ncbi:MAG: fluoride efflux transporter CrcB [Phenylobacterium sp.]|uniref:fluoride efflux transporter CrcB n=1 Tax=Phenylobacterium sp. TaxID=1871053 RepID=UPI0025EF2A90|nr:fluoride efflux transporter CrcB [Phenylobacterium sp.]MCA6227341.1 fluoride efflux transporter CrcB [Phenylobacterium sp.]MCA6230813.1 fluoride efflux transporter CrcB [Phenylobacterium sp.]MCA6235892.1 fluoride efflux transporter CrcB [Phenylobacterium sp.]MCA6250240.1 fluoride efflux transporter CrcB [Phenylobacterium sp.]MCA6250893.1 fluoride efflux transporter CrcB [Phenylobacterium sp.]
MTPANLLLVGLGGGFGAILRYLLSVGFGRLPAGTWPWPTFTANLAGGLAMGLLAGWLSLRGAGEGERLRLLLGVGVLGGFTTFSAFSLETLMMVERRAWGQAGLYAGLSVILSTAAVFLGFVILRRLAA